MTQRQWSRLLILFLGTAACSGERDGSGNVECTLIGCSSSLLIHFEGTTAGQYQITLEADGEVIECTGTVPTGKGVLTCSGQQHFPLTPGSLDAYIAGTPREVRVTIRRDDTPVSLETLTPTYFENRPNGPHCLPVCHNAQETLSLDGG
jgi:hypothetical protein